MDTPSNSEGHSGPPVVSAGAADPDEPESPYDSGREEQPEGERDVQDSARTANRLHVHRRSFDDSAGINPDRSQTASRPPETDKNR